MCRCDSKIGVVELNDGVSMRGEEISVLNIFSLGWGTEQW